MLASRRSHTTYQIFSHCLVARAAVTICTLMPGCGSHLFKAVSWIKLNGFIEKSGCRLGVSRGWHLVNNFWNAFHRRWCSSPRNVRCLWFFPTDPTVQTLKAVYIELKTMHPIGITFLLPPYRQTCQTFCPSSSDMSTNGQQHVYPFSFIYHCSQDAKLEQRIVFGWEKKSPFCVW